MERAWQIGEINMSLILTIKYIRVESPDYACSKCAFFISAEHECPKNKIGNLLCMEDNKNWMFELQSEEVEYE